MKRTPVQPPKGIIAAIAVIVLLAAAVVTVKTMYAPSATQAPQQAGGAETKTPAEVVAALADAMSRSDTEGVLAYVDVDAVFKNLLRFILESESKHKMTDEEFGAYMAKNGAFVWQARDALTQGITTQAHKDAATGGSLLSALVHLEEGAIEPRGDDKFAVVYQDGSFLEFEKREGKWVAYLYVGIAPYMKDYRVKAEEQIRTGMTPPGGAGAGSVVGPEQGR